MAAAVASATGRGARFGRCLPWPAFLALAVLAPCALADGFAPSFGFQYVVVPKSDLDQDRQVRTREYRATIGIAEFDVGGADFDLRADYQYTRFEYEQIVSRNRDLHRLQIPLGVSIRRGGTVLGGHVAAGVAASSNVTNDLLDDAGSDDYYATARVEARIRRTERMHWLAGAAYDRAFGSASLYPILGASWQTDAGTDVRLAFPDSAASFRLSSNSTLELRLYPAGAQWHVVSDELGDDFDYCLEAWRAQVNWSRRVSARLRLDVSAGWEFQRRHEFINDVGVPITADTDDAFLAAVGFRFGDAPLPYSNSIAR